MDAPVIDQAKLEAFAMRAVGDIAAAYNGVMVSLGSKLGLYQALAYAGPLSSRELAQRAGCAERYVREWLNQQAAGGYLGYHAVSDTYEAVTNDDYAAYNARFANCSGSLDRSRPNAIETSKS